MFYEEETIKRILNCKQCNGKLDAPRMLSCGSNICSACSKSIQTDEKHYYKCTVCNKKHSMPQEGLPLNEFMSLFLTNQIKPKEVYRGEAVETLKSLIKKIEEKINHISFDLKSMDRPREHFSSLRRDVQLATKEAIQHIKEFNKELLNEIDQKEKVCLTSIESNEKSKHELKNAVNKAEWFLNEWNQYLKQCVISDESVRNANKNANELLTEANKALAEFGRISGDSYRLRFVKSQEKLAKSLLGCLLPIEFESTILPKEQMIDLMILCGFSAVKSRKLLYRASRDGFFSEDFHLKCDKKPNTFIIIKSTSGHVFGGYTKQQWSIDSIASKADPDAFLFSFINSENKPLVMKCQEPDKAIGFNCGTGPIFGGTSGTRDLCIWTNSDENTKSYSNLGSSYKHPVYLRGSAEAKSFLAGSYNFQTVEIEVYSIF